MSDAPTTRNPAKPARRARRPDQLTVLGFVTDSASEVVLREGLSDLAQGGIDNTADIRRGTIKTAIGAMMKMPAPQILVIDIAGEDRPLQALADLCDVIEPSVTILVLGDIDDVDLYRAIIRQIGAVDYIFKPITREMVARYFAPLINHEALAGDSIRGGRVIAITGARGGVGASSIACALSWLLGVDSNRHTLLLDADPFVGTTADLLGVEPESLLPGLLNGDTTLDAGAIADLTRMVRARLFVLAASPDPGCSLVGAPGAARRLVEAMRVRFNLVIIDLPFLAAQSHRELLELAHHRVIVLDPSVAGLRDTLRLLSIPNGPGQPQRPSILLNREGRSGGLRRKQIEDALKRKIDISIPDLPKPQFGSVRARGGDSSFVMV